MTSKFPLYASMENLVSDTVEELSVEDKKDLISKIKSFDRHAHELVYALIKAYGINENISTTNLPFESKQLKTGIKFNIANFPPKLQHVLKKFATMHAENVQ
ncbi:hypothetical protein [uncultured phage MedDCM-OCT-S09-C23]|mgnify:CR=1 FL=1|jgi:predicted component of type VI protein secretion system|nr:hypothetical protein [uncultured phage MedDCM-OCT-S09-C23]